MSAFKVTMLAVVALAAFVELASCNVVGQPLSDASLAKIRETADCIAYRNNLQPSEIVRESQVVRVHLDAATPTKQSQEFDTQQTTTTATSQRPDAGLHDNNASNATTTLPAGATTEAPVASRTVREGAAVRCGEANANGRSEIRLLPDRIVGGRKSEPGEFPFQVRLNIRSRRGSGICGGIILDEWHILTAAHCLTSCVSQYLTTATIETSGVLATIGDHAIRAQDGEQEIEIERIVPHEKYDACNFYANDHDIAIAKTTTKINYRFTADGYGSINRPCLPSLSLPANESSPPNAQYRANVTAAGLYKDGDSVIVSGWGVTRENSGALSNILRYVKIPVVSNSQCQEVYGSRVSDTHLCAGFIGGGKDSCQGDSGGPLVRVVDNKYELVGIVSFGYGCAQPGAFGVYTRIASYLDWIKTNSRM